MASESLAEGSYLVQNNSNATIKLQPRSASLADPEDVKTDGDKADHTLFPAGSGSIEAMIAVVKSGGALYAYTLRDNEAGNLGITSTAGE